LIRGPLVTHVAGHLQCDVAQLDGREDRSDVIYRKRNCKKYLPTIAVFFAFRIAGLLVLNPVKLQVRYSCLFTQEFIMPAVNFLKSSF